MIKVEEFVKAFTPNKDYKQPKENKPENKLSVAYGTVDPDYTSGKPSVIYDMDVATAALSKPLMRLESYVPAANDRVMIVNNVIIGKIV